MQQRENSGLKEVKPTLQLVRKKIRRFLQETLVSSGEAVQSNNIKLQPTMNPVKMRTKHKMYLTFLLSSACIFLYQYQVAIPRITVFSQQSVSEPALLPSLYLITPTYKRQEQLAELTRMGYLLRNVPNLHWLVMEDADTLSPQVAKVLQKINVPYSHITSPMPAKYRKNKIKPRGVSNRNRGLEWIRANATEGVLYFADDDNSYDLELFEQMRYTKTISMFPVGLIGRYGVSSPIVKNGTLSGYYDGWIGGRKFAVDMAGFAVNVNFFKDRPKAAMPYKAGYEEDGFLQSLAPFNISEIEFLANECTEILVWHTQTKKNNVPVPLNASKYNGTNVIKLTESIVG